MKGIGRAELAIGAAALAAFAGIAVALFGGDDGTSVAAEGPTVIRVKVPVAETAKGASRSRISNHASDGWPQPASRRSERRREQTAAAAAELDETVEKLLKELDELLASRDYEGARRKLRQLRGMGFGEKTGGKGARSGVAAAKRRVLESLGSCGFETAHDVIDFLGDSDPMIANEARNTLFETLRDMSLGDRRRAEIVTAAAEEMTDSYSLTRLFQQFKRMRHSVGVEALAKVAATGSEEARAKIPDAIVTFTADKNVTTVEQLREWLVDNPDAAVDDWYYGPVVVNGGKK